MKLEPSEKLKEKIKEYGANYPYMELQNENSQEFKDLLDLLWQNTHDSLQLALSLYASELIDAAKKYNKTPADFDSLLEGSTKWIEKMKLLIDNTN